MRSSFTLAFLISIAAPAAMAGDLLVVDQDMLKLMDTETGVLQELAPFPGLAQGMAIGPSGKILVVEGGTSVKEIDPVTYELRDFMSPAFGVTGLAITPDGTGYLIRNQGLGVSDQLYRFDAETGEDLELVGPTSSVFSFQSLASDADGDLYAFAVSGVGSGLNRIDPETAEVTSIGLPTGNEGDGHPQWLDFDADGRLFGGRHMVWEIDVETVEFTFVVDGVENVHGASFLEPVPECFLVFGSGLGADSFAPGGFAFQTQLAGISESHAVLMEDYPTFSVPGTGALAQGTATGTVTRVTGTATLPPFVNADGTFAVQVMMWNPTDVPEAPEQYSQVLLGWIAPDGQVYVRPTGDGAIEIGLDVADGPNGGTEFSFPFQIAGF